MLSKEDVCPSLLIHARHLLQPWLDTNCPDLKEQCWIKPCQDERFGHFQSNLAMAAGKLLRVPPREVAASICTHLQSFDQLTDLAIAGPGFVNMRFTPGAISQALEALAASSDLGLMKAAKPCRVVVDYSGPNVAKEMHVGHIRSTILGDCIARMLSACGHDVIRDNHLGDWGTQFGKLILGYKRADKPALEADKAIAMMQSLYQETHSLCENDAALLEQARAELVKLQSGDVENLAIWQSFRDLSQSAFDKIYDQLDIQFELTLAESFYNPMLENVVEELTARNIARESDEAMVVFFENDPQLADKPMLIRKKDGGALYATTDLATLRYRADELKAKQIIYITDGRQQLHFQQLFNVARQWGYTEIDLQHVWFGAILGPDRKPLKTRDGNPIKLQDLLDEAVVRAAQILKDKETDLAAAELEEAAHVIGIGALKYADLSQNRNLDYQFDWDKLLAFEGNTAPYVLNAYVRSRSILRKAGTCSTSCSFILEHEVEQDLARKLLALSDSVEQSLAEYRPHILCAYLYESASLFHKFFEQCPVLKASSPELMASRLALTDLCGQILRQGLSLLGIKTLERM